MGMMRHPKFPLSPMGAVHARNHVRQHRPIGENETFDLACAIPATRVLKPGVELEFTTLLTIDGAPVWECVSGYLFRGKKFGEPGEPSPRQDLPPLDSDNVTESWPVPNNIGRQYAGVGGDYNPIHVATPLAKLFGFKKAIAHGMWSVARALSALEAGQGADPIRHDVVFKGPMFVGSRATLKAISDGGAHRFDVYCNRNPRPSILGWIGPDPGETLVDA